MCRQLRLLRLFRKGSCSFRVMHRSSEFTFMDIASNLEFKYFVMPHTWYIASDGCLSLFHLTSFVDRPTDLTGFIFALRIAWYTIYHLAPPPPAIVLPTGRGGVGPEPTGTWDTVQHHARHPQLRLRHGVRAVGCLKRGCV